MNLIVSFQNSYAEVLTLQCDRIWRWGLYGWLNEVISVDPWSNRTSVLIRRDTSVCWLSLLTNNSQTPPVSLGFQPNSDTIYQEIKSDPTGKGLSPTKPLSASDASHKPRLLLSFWPTCYKLEIPMTPSNSGCQLRVNVVLLAHWS